MTEREMAGFFGTYIKANPPRQSEVYELKFTKNRSIPFNSFKKHQVDQIENLKTTETKFLYHKLSDPPVFYGQRTTYNIPRPFDAIFLREVKSYVVVWFYKPRKPKVFYKIPIGKFIEMRNNANRKSFTEQMAYENGIPIKL